MCRECPVNIDCLEYALEQDLEYGLYCLPERVRRRFKTKSTIDLYKTMQETFTTLPPVFPWFILFKASRPIESTAFLFIINCYLLINKVLSQIDK